MQPNNVLMIGWEYPPHNSGGLGVATQGMTEALARAGAKLYFTLPHDHDVDNLGHVQLLRGARLSRAAAGSSAQYFQQPPFSTYDSPGKPVARLAPYATDSTGREFRLLTEALPSSVLEHRVTQYADRVEKAAHPHATDFGAVHAHDWMSFPAAARLKQKMQKHFIAHVHSTEHDRNPHAGGGSDFIHKLEYEGLQLADTVIAVSAYTRRLLIDRYHVDPDKVRVVHNGIDPVSEHHETPHFSHRRPVVSFMGRLTSQKGAHHFLEIARAVLQRRPEVLFVLAGDGDLYQELLFSTAYHQLSAHVVFSGFIRDRQKARLLNRSDIFIMNSVSEPFGIVALEAAQRDTPVIVSTTSGVKEVLEGAVHADFWDTKRMADAVIRLLDDEAHQRDVVERQHRSLEKLTWDRTADKILSLYDSMWRGDESAVSPLYTHGRRSTQPPPQSLAEALHGGRA